tara:strand:- start:145 stop:843 length:699 start_codon:yes stop_codon:yes gene_type:complete
MKTYILAGLIFSILLISGCNIEQVQEETLKEDATTTLAGEIEEQLSMIEIPAYYGIREIRTVRTKTNSDRITDIEFENEEAKKSGGVFQSFFPDEVCFFSLEEDGCSCVEKPSEATSEEWFLDQSLDRSCDEPKYEYFTDTAEFTKISEKIKSIRETIQSAEKIESLPNGCYNIVASDGETITLCFEDETIKSLTTEGHTRYGGSSSSWEIIPVPIDEKDETEWLALLKENQ